MGFSESQEVAQQDQAANHHAMTPAWCPVPASGEVNALDRWMAEKMLQVVGKPALQVKLWDNACVTATASSLFTLHIHDRNALWCLLYDPEFYFGDLFAAGRVTVEGDLAGFMEVVYRALHQAGRKNPMNDALHWVRHRPRFNSLAGSRKNIHHHYNLSNEFYALWLDQEAMQYTCAYFPQAELSIEQAQVAKLHHICRKLQLKPGDTVVEAGSGWGGLSRFMAQHYGVKVRAYNISSEQIAFARHKADEMGLAQQVEYVEEDYRNISGKYDVFVSVGMLEHVGRQQYESLGQVIDRCLQADGRGLIHSIGRNKPGLMNTWIEKRIFPGAYPPSIKEMMDIFEPNGFSVLDVENLRLHYAKTLQHWLIRFDQHSAQVKKMFDMNFIRAWRLYLAGSKAAFTTSELQLFQIVFAREHNNTLPWSRAHLYTQG
jgi:cyclopropane-fatty-acyl-phospholipid synthase